MIQAKDFSKRENFPGRSGNMFDIALHSAMELENIPAGLFFLFLVGISLFGYYINGLNCLILVVFFIFDWISISLLPKYRRSYGPIKPQVLLLAVFRLLPVLFTVPTIWIYLELLGCILQIYAFWIEPYQIKVSHERIETHKLSTGSIFRILHIGDLHLERHSIREDRLNKIIMELAPDVILFSGDYLCLSSIRDKAAWGDLQTVLKEWQAPNGIYGVTGSPAVDLPENFPELLRNTPVRLLMDEIAILEKNGDFIQVIGLKCTHKPHVDIPRLQKMIETLEPGFRILLHHSPDIAPQIVDGNIDLHLAGHTHGGQVCLPFFGPIFTGSLYGLEFKSGRYLMNNLILYITRGIGLEGLSAPRVRFLCPPEVVMWDIVGKKPENKHEY